MVVFENEFACLEETSLGIIFFPTPALRMDGIQARQLHQCTAFFLEEYLIQLPLLRSSFLVFSMQKLGLLFLDGILLNRVQALY
jgi:hypothetical protein